MQTVYRVLLVLAGVASFLGLVWVLISLFAVRSVENGVSRHIIAWGGIWRGAEFLLGAAVLGLIALAVKYAF